MVGDKVEEAKWKGLCVNDHWQQMKGIMIETAQDICGMTKGPQARMEYKKSRQNAKSYTRLNGSLSGITRVSRYQKGKTNLDFNGARDSEWQWHQLGHMQVCTSLQTDNHASTPPLSFYRPDALPAAQPTASKH